MGYLDFHPWPNLAFALFTALLPRNARQRLTKNLLAVPTGVVLLYHDSWLPPFAQAAARVAGGGPGPGGCRALAGSARHRPDQPEPGLIEHAIATVLLTAAKDSNPLRPHGGAGCPV